LEKEEVITLQIVGLTEREHRTALVIDGDRFANDETYQERITRLLQSVNGVNIKTDVFTRKGNTLVAGTPHPDEETYVSNGAGVEDTLKSFGYDLVITTA